MVIFRHKKTCGISTENYVLCRFKLEKGLIFSICAIRMDLKENYDLCPSTNYRQNSIFFGQFRSLSFKSDFFKKDAAQLIAKSKTRFS
jgi:hypothetical protein